MNNCHPISLIQHTCAITKLAWVSKSDNIITVEHWLHNKWRAGNVSAFIIKEASPGGNGYLGIFAPNQENETIAWLRTKKSYKQGQWLNTTVVSLPREYNKHMVLTDSIIIKGRYCHIFDIRYATKAQKLKSASLKMINNNLAKYNLFASIQNTVQSNSINTEAINNELSFLIKNITSLNEAVSNHTTFTWQEHPAYTALRCSDHIIRYDAFCIKKQLIYLANTLWHDTINYISPSIELIDLNNYLESFTNNPHNEYYLSNKSKITIFNNKAITTIDIDKSNSTWSLKQVRNLVCEIFSILKVLRIGGRIIIDFPVISSKNRSEIISLWKSSKKSKEHKGHKSIQTKDLHNNYHHPVADEDNHDIVQRISLDCLTPGGLLIIQQQSYDRSLLSLYGNTKKIENYLISSEPLIIIHDILSGVKYKTSKIKMLNSIELHMPAICYDLLKKQYSREWNQCLNMCGSTPNIIINKDTSDFSWSIKV